MENGKVIGQLDSITRLAEEGATETLAGLERCIAGVDDVLCILNKTKTSRDLGELGTAETKLQQVLDCLYTTMSALQFQDINTQKLYKVMAMLAELNDYLNELVGSPKSRPDFVVAKDIEGDDLAKDKNKLQVDELVKQFQCDQSHGLK
jgi:hypothetical protein